MNSTEQPINRNESKLLLKQHCSDQDTDHFSEALKSTKPVRAKCRGMKRIGRILNDKRNQSLI
jgi:hypothetical protein